MHNKRLVQQLLKNITIEDIRAMQLTQSLVIDIYRIHIVTEDKPFIQNSGIFLIDNIEMLQFGEYANDLLEQIFTNFIRLSQNKAYQSCYDYLDRNMARLIDFATKHRLPYLYYQILMVLDKQSVYQQFMATRGAFGSFASYYLQDNMFNHNKIDLGTSARQTRQAVLLILLILQQYVCDRYKVRPNVGLRPPAEGGSSALGVDVAESDICPLVNLLGIFYAQLGRCKSGHTACPPDAEACISLHAGTERPDAQTLDEVPFDEHVVTKLHQDNKRIVEQLRRINNLYSYVFDYEILGVDYTRPDAGRKHTVAAGSAVRELSCREVDIDLVSVFVGTHFHNLLCGLDNDAYREHHEDRMFEYGSQFYSMSIIYGCLRQYYRGAGQEHLDKAFFGLPRAAVRARADGHDGRVRIQAEDPKGVMLRTIRSLVLGTHSKQEERDDKIYTYIQKMMMMVPLIGSSLRDAEENTVLKDLSFFYQEQASRYYETGLNGSLAVFFGQDPETFDQREFLRRHITDRLRDQDVNEDIGGLTQIHIRDYKQKSSMNKNYLLIGTLAAFVMANIQYFSMAEIFSNGNFEFVMDCLIKAIRKKSLLRTDLTASQVNQKLRQFVEQNRGKTVSICFSTDKHKQIKEFLMYKQQQINVLSCYQTRIALPDIYFQNYNFHEVVGIENQLYFCSLIINAQNYSSVFIEKYFSSVPEQAIFFLQPILSIIFRSSESCYDHLLQSVCRAMVRRREILRAECMLQTFGSALESINQSYHMKLFIMTYMSQFGNPQDLHLLLVQNKVRWENRGRGPSSGYTHDDYQVQSIVIKSLEFGNSYALTKYQYDILINYENRLQGYALAHIESFMRGMAEMQQSDIVFGLSLVADYIWQRRFTGTIYASDTDKQRSCAMSINSMDDNQLFDFRAFISAMAQAGIADTISHDKDEPAKTDKTQEYYTTVTRNFKKYVAVAIQLLDATRILETLGAHDGKYYRDAFHRGLKTVQHICCFNQLFVKKSGQVDPRSLILDPFAAMMINPLTEVDEYSDPPMEFYTYQLSRMKAQYRYLGDGAASGNYYVDRLACSLVRIGAIELSDAQGNVKDEYKLCYNARLMNNGAQPNK